MVSRGYKGPMTADGISLQAVDVDVSGTPILRGIDWDIAPGERWVVVGPNGSGKTTLLRLLAAWQRPSGGAATVLGERLGRTDMRALRRRIGYTSQSLADLLRPDVSPHDAVLSAPNGALESWWHRYDDDDHADASAQLRLFGIDPDQERRPMRTLSAGERQRVMLARAFTGRPGVVVLDEPTAGLDLGGREDLVSRLDVAATTTTAPMILVTHHLEEIPTAFDRAVVLDGGRIVATGPVAQVLTGDRLSSLFGLDLDVVFEDGRWSARATRRGP